MKHTKWIVWLLVFPFCAAAADAVDATAIAKRVAQNYRQLKAYRIEAETQVLMNRGPQSGSVHYKSVLAVGGEGEFLVQQDDGNELQIRMSDGKTTWKALPHRKLWSKQETSQSVRNDDDDEDAGGQSAMGQDLFTQTQQSLIKRYTALGRYAATTQLEKEARLKWNGEKVECFVLRILAGSSDNQVWITKDSYWVARHIETVKPKEGGTYQITTDVKKFDQSAPTTNAFNFAESSGKQVADLSLPGERNVSLVGQVAVDFTLEDLAGAKIHLAELQGKPVLLDFWATWCPPCRRELPTIEAISKKYKGRLAVYGINDEDAKTARKYLEQRHPVLATLHDEKAKVTRAYGCYSIPTVVILDKSGKVVAHFVGERPESDLVAALKQAGLE